MKKRHHLGNKNIMMSPTLAAKERSGPSLTSGLSDQPGKGGEGDIMAKASIGGRKGPRHEIQEANQKIASRRAQFGGKRKKEKPSC